MFETTTQIIMGSPNFFQIIKKKVTRQKKTDPLPFFLWEVFGTFQHRSSNPILTYLRSVINKRIQISSPTWQKNPSKSVLSVTGSSSTPSCSGENIAILAAHSLSTSVGFPPPRKKQVELFSKHFFQKPQQFFLGGWTLIISPRAL